MSSTQITHTHKIEFRILFKASLDLENISKPRADGKSDLIVEADISKVKYHPAIEKGRSCLVSAYWHSQEFSDC